MITWTFGPNGIYTATWDGVNRVTVTLTTGGAFVTSFVAQSFSAALASPEYQAIAASGTPFVGFSLLAATPVTGYTMINGTGTIVSWTAPNDGKMHRFSIFATLAVSSAATGGTASFAWTCGGIPRGGFPVFGGNGGSNSLQTPNFPTMMACDPASTVTVVQDGALTVGAAKAFVEIWGS